MPDTLFLQIHTLTAYAASLLNRDDIGRAKRMPYGGVSRLRVSSQCLKRHLREVASAWSLAELADPATGGTAPGTVRSRKIISRAIGMKLVEQGYAVDDVITVLSALKAEVLGESKKAKSEKAAKKTKGVEDEDATTPVKKRIEDALDTNQVIVLGQPEIDFLRTSAETILSGRPNDFDAAVKAYFKNRDTLENFRALRLASGLDAAMFGRMVTSDILARGDGAVHVAHALTVHKEESEPEYFVAIDDITRDAGELGTGLIQTTELTSGLYYGYVVIDVPQLVSNLEGVSARDWRKADLTLAAGAVERLIHLLATTSPGAKRGSTAPYGYADLVMVEAGTRQPRSLMTAFHAPVSEVNARQQSVAALARHLAGFDAMYGKEEARRVASVVDATALLTDAAELGGLAGLAHWAAAQLTAPQAPARAA
jgi:CRISPR system Cascade subunit CasC